MNIAVLLDLDNIKPNLEQVEQVCRRHGRLVERRAFSNTPAVLAAYGGAFRQYQYRFELTPGLDPVPQEVDGLLVRTAWELSEQARLNLNMIAVVSNDNGYAELLQQLKSRGIKTLVLANQPGKRLSETADFVESLGEVLRTVPIGIDLGTTNTVVAVATQNLRRDWSVQQMELTLPNAQGALERTALVPSCVRFQGNQAQLGEHVRAQFHAFRNSTVFAWKDHMGVSQHDKPFSYDINNGVLPEEAASSVLKFCRQEIQERFPGRTRGVVITHPASYEADAVEATRRAACLAGWSEEEVILLPEPHAALYHFLHQLQQGELADVLDVTHPRTLAVYDLGGGTLDVSLHRVCWNETLERFEVEDLAVGSRTRMGGNRIDDAIAEHVMNHAPIRTLPPERQQQLRVELTLYAEKFKKLWGAGYEAAADKSAYRSFFQGNFLEGEAPIRYPIDAAVMAKILDPYLCQDLSLKMLESMDPARAFDESPFTDRLDTLVVPVLEILLKARARLGSMPQLEAVLHNGGMTYFPLVKARLKELLGPHVLHFQPNPDFAVARGAALYAAGAQGQASRRINPSHISLEVKTAGKPSLIPLVAQGQAYPYRRLVKGLAVPDAQQGNLNFPIWVGMGSRPGHGTVLQRFRSACLNEVAQAGLSPGSRVDLEVDYGFDERLKLTLVHPDDPKVRLLLEVGRESPPAPALPTSGTLSLSVPPVKRLRVAVDEGAGREVEVAEWTRLAADITRFPSDGPLWDRFRALEQASTVASNRANLFQGLVDQLLRMGNGNQIGCRVLFRAARSILSRYATGDPRVVRYERRLELWVRDRMQQSSNLDPNLNQELAETPGKLLWDDWSETLLTAYQKHRQVGWSVTLLNSLGKCGQRPQLLVGELLGVIAGHSKPPHREKAAWALGRLAAPGQPPTHRFDPTLAFDCLPKLLARLEKESVLTVIPSLVGAIFQIASWELAGQPLPPLLRQSLCGLHWHRPNEKRFPEIQKAVRLRLSDLRSMLNLKAATPDERSRIQEYLLELVSD